jgi:hypothetical protein
MSILQYSLLCVLRRRNVVELLTFEASDWSDSLFVPSSRAKYKTVESWIFSATRRGAEHPEKTGCELRANWTLTASILEETKCY